MNTHQIYIGTYTGPMTDGVHRPDGIFLLHMNPASGLLEKIGSFPSGPNPSFIEIHPRRPFLFAVNELLDEGFVSSFSIEPQTARLELNNRQSTHGGFPCYLCIDPSGKWLMVANYKSGSLAVFPINPDGSLGSITDLVQHHGKGPNTARQEAAHAHSVRFDPEGKYLLAADLGADKVYVYTLDTKQGRLLPHDPIGLELNPGVGPRHLQFHPYLHRLYISDELDSTVTVCSWNQPKGFLEVLQTISTLPQDWHKHNDVADLHLTPTGRFLYVSNRGHDSLAIFMVGEVDGLLTSLGFISTEGRWPRNFAIAPSGDYVVVANQKSDSVIGFHIDLLTGQLYRVGEPIQVPSPVFVKFIDS